MKRMYSKNTYNGMFVILILGMAMFGSILVAPAHGEATTSIFLSPANRFDSTKTPGTTFTVDVFIDDVASLFAWQLSIDYQDSILTATGFVTASNPWGQAIATGAGFGVGPLIDDETGNLVHAFTFLQRPDGSLPTFSTTQPARLGTITFEVEMLIAQTPITIIGESPFPTDTLLVDMDFSLIPYSSSDAIFANTAEGPRAPFANPGGPYTGMEGSPVSFDGTRSTDPNGDIVSYAWSFGDGAFGTGPNPTHVYRDGPFTSRPKLTVTDDQGLTDTAATLVRMFNVPPAVSVGPDRNVFSGDTVQFEGSFTDPGLDDTHTIHWDFDDGTSVEGVLNPSHVYLVPRMYRVTLTVTDDDEGRDSARLLVTVLPIPISIDVKPGSDPNSINTKSQGRVPVAILTSPNFDGAMVNVISVRFGRTGTEAAAVQGGMEDVDGDGDLDLILHFRMEDTGIQEGDTMAVLTGMAIDGTFFGGTDLIRPFLPGDVDGDSEVDIKDAFLLVYALMSTQGMPNWNPYADIDDNGIVDLADAEILSLNYR